jgi:hypothetical protein
MEQGESIWRRIGRFCMQLVHFTAAFLLGTLLVVALAFFWPDLLSIFFDM